MENTLNSFAMFRGIDVRVHASFNVGILAIRKTKCGPGYSRESGRQSQEGWNRDNAAEEPIDAAPC